MRPLSLLLLALVACAPEGADDDGADTDPGQPIVGDLETLRGQQVFDVPLRDPVDVLFVVDDLAHFFAQFELPLLAGHFTAPLVDAGVDAHIGAVTTDMDSSDRRGRLLGQEGSRWATTDARGSAEEQLAEILGLVRGLHGSFDEDGTAAALEVLAPSDARVRSHNAGFLRPSSRLHLIFVVEDESDESAFDALRRELYRQEERRPQGVSVSAIGASEDGCVNTSPYGFIDPMPAFTRLVDDFDGLAIPLCDEVVGADLEALATHTLTAGPDRVYLAELPIPASIEGSVLTEAWERPLVSLADQPEGTRCQDCVSFQYEVQRNALRFVEPLPFGARVTVDYELLEARD